MARAGEKLIEVNGVKHKPLNEMDFRLILALAENNMKATETAYALDRHRNCVMYRIDKIKRITGLDPLNFYDLHKLVEMVNTGVINNAE